MTITPFRLTAESGQSVQTVASRYTPERVGEFPLMGVALNQESAVLAARAVQATARNNDEDETQLADMVANLCHLADLLGVDVDEVLDRGQRHYDREIRRQDT